MRTPASKGHNLPAPPTPFVGRERELADLRDLLLRPGVRLVTLTGLGGVGKTRLALQVAAGLVEDFPDGVYLVRLAPLADPALLASAIAQSLEVPVGPERSAWESVLDFLQDKRALILLDNFEHLLDGAPQIAELLSTCPAITALVTSQAALRVAAELEFPVLPLALPDPARPPPAERLSDYDAAALFISRARAVRPEFAITDDNAPTVLEICHRLEGLPLAIELAAARIKLLPPRALLERLDSRLKVLVGGARDAPDRQRTLRAAIDWSHGLLSPHERALFARIGVFVGGCTLAAVAAVCGDAGGPPSGERPAPFPDVLETLSSLLEKSLVQRESDTGVDPWVIMLETIRDYALERLEEREELDDIRRRHADYYLALAERAETRLARPTQVAWLERLERERGNLRAALRWVVERGEPGPAVHLGAALWRAERAIALHEAGLEALTRVAQLESVAALVSGADQTAEGSGAYARATVLAEEPPVGAADGTHRGVATPLLKIAETLVAHRDLDGADLVYRECLVMCREVGDRFGLAVALEGLSYRAGQQGQADRSARLLGAAESLYEKLGAALHAEYRTRTERTAAAARTKLGADAFARAVEAGRAMALPQVVEYALGQAGRAANVSPPHSPDWTRGKDALPLTRREREVAVLIARASTNKQIAAALSITERTAETHVDHILRKLGFDSRIQVATWAIERGLLETDNS